MKPLEVARINASDNVHKRCCGVPWVIKDVTLLTCHLNDWERCGLSGLYDAPRCGRPCIYTAIDAVHLKAFLDESPQQLRQAQSQLTELTGKSSSLETIKRLLKKTLTIAGNAVVAQ